MDCSKETIRTAFIGSGLAVCFGATAFAPLSLHADPQSNPDAFFKKNFATDTNQPAPIIAKGKKLPGKVKKPEDKVQKDKKTAQAKNMPKAEEVDVDELAAKKAAEELAKSQKKFEENNSRIMAAAEQVMVEARTRTGSTGVPVESISAIVSPDKSGKFSEQIDALLALAIAFNIDVGGIYAPGSYMLAKPDQHFFLDLYRGKFSAEKKLPAVYSGIKSTPVWIVTTEFGSVIYEGFKAIDSKFSPRGELIDVSAVNQLKKAVSEETNSTSEAP